MRITRFGTSSQVRSSGGSAAPAAGAAASDFAGLVDREESPSGTQDAAAAPSVVAAAPRSSPDALADTGARDRQASRHADAMLRALAKLQISVLTGGGEAARCGLAELADTRPAAADPALEDALRAIAVRAAVELARPR